LAKKINTYYSVNKFFSMVFTEILFRGFYYVQVFLLAAMCVSDQPSVIQNQQNTATEIRFKKHVITNDFISEGVTVGDVNRDGKLDIIAGAYWFEAPTWTRHDIAKGEYFSPSDGYSNSFLNFSMDVNQDGWVDLIRISLPGQELVWYENPKNKPGYWPMRTILKTAGNESPAFVDVDGDGRQDILCNDPEAKEMIWLKSPSLKGDTLWEKFVIAKGDIPGIDRYTHGLGWADMNGDGRPDVIISKGWWESPVDPKMANWVFHPADLGEDCSQIYALDVKANGEMDLISSSAHRYGIWWHEKTRDEKGNTVWNHHMIFKEFSQSHALAMADINGDGHPDLVTGKRYFAHNGKDPGAFEPAVLYWFEFLPGKNPLWIPHLIDDNSGVGLQVVAQDINQDGLMDIVVANKKGVFFFEQMAK
jgi:FG-GAP-like repeat/FG-GAP repeat